MERVRRWRQLLEIWSNTAFASTPQRLGDLDELDDLDPPPPLVGGDEALVAAEAVAE
jgi:hypothetical protein